MALIIVRPMIIPLLTSLILAYMFYPFYKWLVKKLNKKNLCAFLVSLLIILLLTIPVAFVLFEVTKEVNVGYILLKQKIAKGEYLEVDCKQFLTYIHKRVVNKNEKRQG